MVLEPVACLSDNYAWLVHCPHSGATAVVDPSESAPVRAALEARGWGLDAILCTHHHFDHVGGVLELREHYGAALPVYGHESEGARIPGLDHPLAHGQRFALGKLLVEALHVPAHTLGALAFVVEGQSVCTGDTAFCGGCGRLFEGSAAQLYHALHETLGALGDGVAMYPGHEYALKNLRFASTIEPDNAALSERLALVQARRERGENCAPSTLGDERASNPFFRVHERDVKAWARAHGVSEEPVSVLGALRAARDGF